MSSISQKLAKEQRINSIEEQLNAPLADLLYQMHWGENLMHQQVAQSVGVPRPTVTRWFSELGVPSQLSERITKTYLTSWLYKTGRLQRKPRYDGPDRRLQETRNGVNVAFFKRWTPEMAYVLGYFAADGCLARNRRGSHYIQFISTDVGILRQLKRVLNTTQAIRRKTGRRLNAKWRICYQLQIGSLGMYRGLLGLGLTPRKASRLKMPAVPVNYLSNFVRGFFDGDGCVSYGSYPRAGSRRGMKKVLITRFTSSSKGFLRDLERTLETTAGLEGGGIVGGTRAFHLQYSVADSIRLFHFMYDNLDRQPFLRRKRLKFLRALVFIREGP